jgi:hypothetical protein
MTQDSSVKLASVTAAVTATAAAGYYAYDQYSKRYPRLKQQRGLLTEVGVVGTAISVTLVQGTRLHVSCARDPLDHVFDHVNTLLEHAPKPAVGRHPSSATH